MFVLVNEHKAMETKALAAFSSCMNYSPRDLLVEWPHVVNGPHVMAQGPICKYYIHQGAGGKLPPLPLLYI